MAEFKEIQIEDKAWVDAILENQENLSLENNFTTAFIWRNIFGITISSLQGGKFYTTKTKDNSFMFPCGSGDIKPALEELFEYCKENGIKPKFYSLTKKNKEILESLYPDKFSYKENRDGSDYVYEKEKLATLSGKKLSAKRNHINRFVEAYPDWEYEKIDESNIKEAYLMNEKWCEMAGLTPQR